MTEASQVQLNFYIFMTFIPTSSSPPPSFSAGLVLFVWLLLVLFLRSVAFETICGRR